MASQQMRERAREFYTNTPCPCGHIRNEHTGEDCQVASLMAFAASERALVIAQVVQICDNEKVNAEDTKSEGDEAYNLACDHIKAAIRALSAQEERENGRELSKL
jgi:hypothetical protein